MKLEISRMSFIAKTANTSLNSDSQKRRFALLFPSGYLKP